MRRISIMGKGGRIHNKEHDPTGGWKNSPEGNERWGLNNMLEEDACDLDLVFLMHERSVMMTEGSEGKKIYAKSVQRIIDEKIPCFTLGEFPEIPQHEIYPIEEVLTRFETDYITNSVPYMIAIALLQFLSGEKPMHIDFCGVNYAVQQEYIVEKGGTEYWLGIIDGLAISGLPITYNILGGMSMLKRALMFQKQFRNLYGYPDERKAELIKLLLEIENG